MWEVLWIPALVVAGALGVAVGVFLVVTVLGIYEWWERW